MTNVDREDDQVQMHQSPFRLEHLELEGSSYDPEQSSNPNLNSLIKRMRQFSQTGRCISTVFIDELEA